MDGISIDRENEKTIDWRRYRDLKVAWPKWLIETFVPMQSVGLLYGARGQGKTFLALDWAASVAAGKEWQGHAINSDLRDPKVAYLLAEKTDGLRRRLLGWLFCRQGDEALLHKNMVSAQGMFHLDTQEGCDRLIESLKSVPDFGGLELLIIDPLASYMSGSENDTRDMQKFSAGLHRISETFGCTVLVVHHEGKRNKKNALGARGSSALEAAMDTVIYLAPGARKDEPSQLVVTKQREFETRDKVFLEFRAIASDQTNGAGHKDLGIFPEKVDFEERDDESRPARPKKKDLMRALDGEIVTSIQRLVGSGQVPTVEVILEEVRRHIPDDNPEFTTLDSKKLRSRLTLLHNAERLERSKEGPLSYTVVERRASDT